MTGERSEPTEATEATEPTEAPPKLVLRPYQHEAIEAVVAARARGVRRMVISLPTGAGKTVIFSQLAARERGAILVLAHREELLTQAKDKLQRAIGDAGTLVAIEQGDQRAPDDARVVVASIRSLHEERLERLCAARRFSLIIYDECHHAPATDNQRVLRQLGAFDHDFTGALVGVTATTMRGDGQGLDEVFEELIYSRTIPDMVRDGYLSKLRGYRITTMGDLRRVATTTSDFQLDDLAEAVDIQERNALVARAIQELARDRRTITFCVTVAHAENLARALNAIGLRAAIIHGMMKREARARTLEAFRQGRFQVITNVGVLTEGFDDPGVSCIAMARPTRSAGLYIQCVGRGTRLAPGKDDCLVLDFADVSELSLVTLPSLFGMPYEMDLEGEEVTEVAERLEQIIMKFPHFEIPPGDITLDEIKARAEAFDPLTMDINPEVAAISPNAWESLGSAGLALHIVKAKRLIEYVVIQATTAGRVSYKVLLDGQEVAQLSRVEEAVEAVDYEVQRLGPRVSATALPDARWRALPPRDEHLTALAAMTPPRTATTLGQAVRLIAFNKWAKKTRWWR